MLEPAQGLKTSLLSHASFFNRIQENFQSVWKLPWVPLPADHAPIGLLNQRGARGTSVAQIGSTCLHLLVCGALVLMLNPRIDPMKPTLSRAERPGRLEPPILKRLSNTDRGSLGKSGSSGGRDPLPSTAGELALPSKIALLPPDLADGAKHPLFVPVTIQEADAPQITPPVGDLGLPWMKDKNGSEGDGEHGIGDGRERGMGDGLGDGTGVASDPGRYRIAASQVACRYCPDPSYSDEARRQKLQGTVTMRVLVGVDGRAKDLQITRRLGLGLDENAVQTVRSWQFIPAKDAAQRPVASWITIETLFRLY
jgi:protein TonB